MSTEPAVVVGGSHRSDKDMIEDAATTALATMDAASPLPVFRGRQMAEALVAYQELQQALDKAMPDQLMTLDGRPFRKKGYWRAVAVAFNLTIEPTEERREVSNRFDDGRDNFGYVVTYHATAPNGRTAAGDGSCFAVEKARRFKCPHPERPGSKRTLHFPQETCPDFDPAYQWHALPGQATEHNIRSHAHTRAFNRAVSNLVGFGEVSAEEVERSTESRGGYSVEAPGDARKPEHAGDSTSAVVPSVPNGGENSGHSQYATTQSVKPDPPSLPPGAVLIQRVDFSPTKNANITKAFVVLSTGEQLTTIKAPLQRQLEQWCQDQTPVIVETKATKWGRELVSAHADTITAPLTDAELEVELAQQERATRAGEMF